MSPSLTPDRPRGLRTATVTLGAPHDADVSLQDRDRTRTFLLLHGGGGPGTMSGFADLLADRTHSRVLLPTHPGFAGTPRPRGLDSPRALAAAYVDLVERLDLVEVALVGNSFGGWLAAEMALLGTSRVSSAVVVDGIGLDVVGHPVANVAGLSAAEIAALSWHDPAQAPRPPAGTPAPSPDLAALQAYTASGMTDPTLLDRLAGLNLPVHVVWWESDRIVDVAHAHAYAEAMPGSTLTLLPDAGHLPQLETPVQLLDVIAQSGC